MNVFNGKIQNIGNGTINILKQIKNVGSQFSFWVGILLILFIIMVTFFIPCPSVSQFNFFRIIIALALASVAASLPKFFQLAHSGTIKIGTGFAVFIVVYFFNPASSVIKDNCNEDKRLKGKVLYSGLPLPGARINAASLNETDITNGIGEFDIPYTGNLEMPINIHVKYGCIDTIFIIDKYNYYKTIHLELEDTIPAMTTSLANQLIQACLDIQRKKMEASHHNFMVKYQGEKTDLSNISAIYQTNENHCRGYYGNNVVFENGFIKLTTQKDLRNAGILIDPFNPYGAYYLHNYEAYIYKDSFMPETRNGWNRLHFSLFNLDEITFRIESFKVVNPKKYLIRVLFKNNIRFVRTEADFRNPVNSYTRGRKDQTTFYWGMRPLEEFIVTYIEGRWQITGTR